MLFSSNLISKASGSANGIVASHNKGGMYFRQRSTPINPNTIFQQVVRNAATVLTTRWSGTLTQAQRDAWAVYATNQLFVNKLGESRQIPGLAAYLKCNSPRIQAALAIIDAAPTTFVLPTFTITSVSLTAATDLASIAYPTGQAWAATGGALIVYISRPQSVGINYFKGPYQFADSINGAAVPPVSPQTVPAPFDYTAGQKFFARIRASNPDGRLSSDQFFSGVAA